MNEFGFKNNDLNIIVNTISALPGIEKAVIFGSRAKGNYKEGSDVDIAVWTLSNDTALQLWGNLNDKTLLPYKFDVLNYNKIDNSDLKDHIQRMGIEIYSA